MDLSEVFDTLDYSLYAHGFDFNSLNFVQSYLINRFQRLTMILVAGAN